MKIEARRFWATRGLMRLLGPNWQKLGKTPSNFGFVTFSLRKKFRQVGLKIYFPEKSSGIFGFVTLPLEITKKKQACTPGNSAKLNDTPWKFKIEKSRHIEIPHDFFLNTPGLCFFWNIPIALAFGKS